MTEHKDSTNSKAEPQQSVGVDEIVIPFGKQVHVTKKYHRIMNGWKKEYISQPFDATGIFLGWRTIQNGETHCDDYGCVWEASNYLAAALVAFSPKKNPIYIPIDGIDGRIFADIESDES